MIRACLIAGVALLLPAAAHADIPPPPGSEERDVAQIIAQQGHACPRVTSLRPATPAESAGLPSGFEYDRSVASCNNGRRFVVAKPARLPGPRRPNQPTQSYVRPLQ